MTASALFRYSLPALLVGAISGYFAGQVLDQESGRSSRKASTLRDDFLSSDDDEIDYDKVARVCLAAASRSPVRHTSAKASVTAVPDSPKVLKTKERLDSIMSRSLEEGVWSRGAGFLTEGLLQQLPPSDVADFETLLRTTVERGDLEVQPGAWVPEELK